MTTMISEVYAAFRTAGVPEAEARKAAEALSSENLATKGDIRDLQDDTRERFVRVEKELLLIKWMLGLIIAVEVIPLFKVFFT